MVDQFLIGTVLFVIAVGLYQLFFTTMRMPLLRWLLVHDVGDLERKLIGLSSRSRRWCSWARS